MGSHLPRYWTMWLAPTRAALAAGVVLVVVTSCGSDQSSSGHTPSSTSPTPRQTGISATEAAALVPLAPRTVTAEVGATGVQVTWPGTGQDDVHYLVHRKAPGSQEWTQLAAVAISGDNRGTYGYVDTSAEHGKTYVYGVGAVNSAGRESAITESGPVTVPAS